MKIVFLISKGIKKTYLLGLGISDESILGYNSENVF